MVKLCEVGCLEMSATGADPKILISLGRQTSLLDSIPYGVDVCLRRKLKALKRGNEMYNPVWPKVWFFSSSLLGREYL